MVAPRLDGSCERSVRDRPRPPLRVAREHRILSSVNRASVALSRRARIYCSSLVIFLLALGTLAHGQVNLTVDPAMTKGAAGAPVTIVEFSDYQ